MSMTDPIADMLTRIRNAQLAGHANLTLPRSKLKVELAKILSNEGFIEGFVEDARGPQGDIKLFLKYDSANKGTIRGIRRVSRPSRRVYVGKDEVPRVRNGLGIAILTTPRGVLTDAQARRAGVGGEVICHVW
ncbi:MAG: 30S ribosomal protein S8 [Alphaproteobacteria bacterium]|nr:30S ribosomal protein S8 [Alphaproteobacteria bacterium]MCB9696132.1 30S ribosomal protein S8 [Alphaproteobacteria bacterium]